MISEERLERLRKESPEEYAILMSVGTAPRGHRPSGGGIAPVLTPEDISRGRLLKVEVDNTVERSRDP